MGSIEIGLTTSGSAVSVPLRSMTRHGLIIGSTGSGKTTTTQAMIEQLSAAGVPVFAADVKGDLSGIAAAGDSNGVAAARAAKLGRSWSPQGFPAAFWDIYGAHGLPVRTSVQAMGAQLLSSMLGLNETQAGTMAIAFRMAEDDRGWMLTLDDLRWTLNDMTDNRDDVCKKYGNVTASSIAAIQRGLLTLEAQGGDRLFGEPPFDIADFMRTDDNGQGVVNLLHADRLLESPKLYATFLLWLLTELFRKLPEAGDLPKPKLVFFFDEAHLLFSDAPKDLVQAIERLVRLVRSKGVGVYLVTQSPTDVPANVLEQLGTRILHAMRAHTPPSLKKIRAAADTIRPRKGFNAREELPNLAIGEALVSVIGEDNVPSEVEKVSILPPAGQIGPVSELERSAMLDASPLRTVYAAGLTEAEARYRFVRRMKVVRGIDPGEDAGPAAYDPEMYRKYVPTMEVARPRRNVLGALLGIAGWAVVAAAGISVVTAII